MQCCKMTAPAPPSPLEGRIRPIAAPYKSAELIDEEVSCVFDCWSGVSLNMCTKVL